MKIQALAINKIDQVISDTKDLMAIDRDPLFPAFWSELIRYRSLVESHWPLDENEKNSVDIGRVAIVDLKSAASEFIAESGGVQTVLA
ncbi:hypothetical protein JOD97_005427 [Duganella sp. 1411]|jgi:hypothetical protein|uniref:hypothetical protein n=1 Tax=Duganella sp. 1411 TaxID=2806572 RepID=UPI001AE652DD|nr:hypothetical protein [Duganella sp. 1411]MBP1207347.1 hypothetical protein [Duganella sp. 1411]